MKLKSQAETATRAGANQAENAWTNGQAENLWKNGANRAENGRPTGAPSHPLDKFFAQLEPIKKQSVSRGVPSAWKNILAENLWPTGANQAERGEGSASTNLAYETYTPLEYSPQTVPYAPYARGQALSMPFRFNYQYPRYF